MNAIQPTAGSQPDTTLAAQLHDIVVPEPVSWMPQTAGWYIVLALLVLGSAYIAYRAYRRARANRYRKDALGELARIEQQLRDKNAPDESSTTMSFVLSSFMHQSEDLVTLRTVFVSLTTTTGPAPPTILL